jgi:ABC-2 type transport system permease protein
MSDLRRSVEAPAPPAASPAAAPAAGAASSAITPATGAGVPGEGVAAPPRPGKSAPPAARRRRYSPLWQLITCRIKEFVREPEAMFWVFAFPVLLAIALGLAFREKPPDRIPVAVVGDAAVDRGAAPTAPLPGAGAAVTADAARLAAALGRAPELLVHVVPAEEARRALRTGKVSLLVVPGTPPVFRFDETRPDSRIARLAAGDVLEHAAGRIDPVPIRSERVTEKGARYIDFLIPGLLGLNLMGTGIWSLAFSITTARSRRVLKRLVATPMRKSQYLLSQVLGRLVFLLPEVAVLLGSGWLLFGVAVHGSLAAVLLLCLLSAMAFAGIGLLVASRVRTVEGVSGLANLVMMPMWLVSGSFFSAERFPDRLQPLVRALPLTAVNDALRALITDGQPLWSVWPQLAVIAAWGLASFLVALRIFRWQ